MANLPVYLDDGTGRLFAGGTSGTAALPTRVAAGATFTVPADTGVVLGWTLKLAAGATLKIGAGALVRVV